MRTRLIAPVVSAAAVVTLIVGVSVAVRGADDDPEPRRLSLAAAGAPESAAASGGGIASDSRSAGGSGVRLDATLPDEPDEARAYDLEGRSDEDTVRRLARALGIDAAPTRTDGRWVVENGERRLDVEPSGHWSYFPAPVECGGPDSPVSSGKPYDSCMTVVDPAEGSGSGAGSSGSAGSATGSATVDGPAVSTAECPPDTRCMVATPEPAPAPPSDSDCPPESCTPAVPPVGEPRPEPTPVPDATARDAAAPVFDALGLRGDTAVMQAGSSAIVSLNPRVDGLRTSGWATFVEVTADGAVLSGNGWLATARGADVYPLITAQAAYDEWSKMFAQPMTDCGPTASCAYAGPPMVVTGAELGLMLTFEKDRPLLVPAWLFELAEQPEAFAHLAIDPAYLAPPDETPQCLLPEGCTEPAPDPGGSGGAEPAPEPGTARSAFSFDRYAVSADGLTLTLGYGESGSCPREAVTAQVKESPDSVVVVLEENTPPPDRACTADYHPAETAVTLEAPLGKRPVIDGVSGEPRSPEPAP